MRRWWTGVAVMAWVAAAAGCADPVDRLIANQEVQSKIVSRLSRDTTVANQLLEKALADDSLRAEVLNHLLANRQARERILAEIASDPAKMDDLLAMAVRQPGMKAHLLTLMKGMEMATPQ